jgi:hypothetical protein
MYFMREYEAPSFFTLRKVKNAHFSESLQLVDTIYGQQQALPPVCVLE